MTDIRSIAAAAARYVARCTRQDNGCLINERLAPGTYGEVRFDGRRTTAHRAVLATASGGMPAPSIVARHKCDNPRCVEVSHLEFGTVSENVHDAYKRDRRTGGWAHGEGRFHVLTADTVRAMRRRASAGASLVAIVAEFGTPYSPTRMAVRGETWKSITDVPAVAGRTNAKPNPRAYRFTRTTDAQTVLSLTNAGLSLSDIGDQLGIGRSTAWSLLQTARGAVA